MANDVRAAVERVLPGVREDLEHLVRIPSVSADPTAAGHVRASAEAVAALLRGCDMEDVQILEVEGGAPAVVARKPAPPGKPTVLLYGHHDVQPTGDPAEWTSPPFEPVEREGRLYGRGAADDKAGVMAHVAALRAFGNNPPVGVTVFVEGEEELGSPALGPFLSRYRDLLIADVIVLADSGNWDLGVPALTTSLRGLIDCFVEVQVLDHPVHSGMYGGVVMDALTALCRLLATLHDDDGTVAISGLASGSAAPLDLPEERLRAEAGILDGVRLIGTGPLVDRLWAKPAATVLAIDTTRIADASNTLLATAKAKVSVRLAPGDDAKSAMDRLVEHLTTHAPFGARVTVTPISYGEPFKIDARGPRYDAARAAFQEAWGREPVDMGVGGTIPFVAEFAEAFPEAAILVTGVEDPDSRAHGFDESLHLDEYSKACLAEALMLEKLANLS
jgi:acetylornithine deacetylase/succinyl-diaminopimelate desuccinylase-like protein